MSLKRGVELMRRYRAIDAVLVEAGFHPTSPFFLALLDRWYAGRTRTLVARCGRRSGKSSTWCRLAVLEALYGGHRIPPGDLGHVMFISTSRDEAGARLRTIKAILDALDIAYRPSGDTIELNDRPIAFKVYSASIAGVSGPTSILVIADEVAKWRDADTGANPAKEVLATARPTMATQPNARMVLSSSPLGSNDAHAEAFDRGDTDDQVTVHAPTWVANPTITEDETHRLEPDERVWRREYKAIPQASALGAFDDDATERAFRTPDANVTRHRRVLVIDASSGRKDSWTWGRVGYDQAGARRMLRFDSIEGVEGSFWSNVSGDEIVMRIATEAKRYGISSVYGDQREALMISSAFSRIGLHFKSIDWTQPRKVAAVARLRRLFAERAIILPDHDQLRRELRSFEERITSGGSFTYGARGNAHDDYVALLLTAAMADEEKQIPGSPIGGREPYTSCTSSDPDPRTGNWGAARDPGRGVVALRSPMTVDEAIEREQAKEDAFLKGK